MAKFPTPSRTPRPRISSMLRARPRPRTSSGNPEKSRSRHAEPLDRRFAVCDSAQRRPTRTPAGWEGTRIMKLAAFVLALAGGLIALLIVLAVFVIVADDSVRPRLALA